MKNGLRLFALLAVSTAAFLNGCYSEHPKFKSTDITGADWGKKLKLTGHDGRARTLEDFRGKIVVLTFGFTNCPDVCPTTLAEVAQAVAELKRAADRVQVLFITLDPERDTSAVLAKYVPAFDARFLGLYGDEHATRDFAKEFKIFYEKRKSDSPGRYSVDHSAQSYVLDANGRLRLFVKHERIGTDLAHDLKELLREDAKKRKKA